MSQAFGKLPRAAKRYKVQAAQFGLRATDYEAIDAAAELVNEQDAAFLRACGIAAVSE